MTIATHNGSAVSVPHNLRLPEVCKHEPHIDPNGIHEVWQHEDLRSFYERTFQPAADAYDKTARGSRKVGDYLDKLTREAVEGEAVNEEIKQRNKAHKAKGEQLERLRPVKKPVYEMIAGVYPQDGLELSERERRELLHLWFYGDGTPENPGFQARNPHLAVVGAYYHADEPDAEPHLHIDYVPVGEFTRGMQLQNSLERALSQQGMKSGKVPGLQGPQLMTAQEQFQEAERNRLQEVCEAAGLEVVYTQRGKRSRHISTAEKRACTRLEELDEEIMRRTTEAEAIREAAEATESAAEARAREIIREAHQRAEKERQALNTRRGQLEAWEQELDDREEALEQREAVVSRKEAALTAVGQELYERKLKEAQQQRQAERSEAAALIAPTVTPEKRGKRAGKIPPSGPQR